MNDTIIEAILAINPSAQVSVSGEDLDTIVWENGTASISKSDIEAKMKILNEADVILQKIYTLEATVTPRRIRAMTTVSGAKWVDDVEKLIAIERAKL